jgi:hypothetical protein
MLSLKTAITSEILSSKTYSTRMMFTIRSSTKIKNYKSKNNNIKDKYVISKMP